MSIEVVICWYDRLTGQRGEEGRPIAEEAALAWIEQLKTEYPHLAYWLRDATKEEVQETTASKE